MPRAASPHLSLHLNMPADRIRIGKRFAQLNGTTVSGLVSEMFGALERLESDPLCLDRVLEPLAGMVPDPGKARREVVMEALESKYGSS